MTDLDTTDILRIKGNEIASFKTVENYFRIPLINDQETTASVRFVEVDGSYTFPGLCIEGIGEEVGAVLDMKSGVLYELVSL